MEEPDEEQRYVRKYLLSYLDEGERQAVEERLMTDPGYLKEVLMTESELMEDYLDGTLPEGDRERFERYVLATERQVEKLALTKALGTRVEVKAAANSPPAKRSRRASTVKGRASSLLRSISRGAQPATVTVLAIFLFGVVVITVILVQNYRRVSLEQKLSKLNTQFYMDAEAVLRGYVIGPLRPGLPRDVADVNPYAIPESESVIQLRLQIGAGEYQSFEAAFRTAEDNEVFTLGGLKDKLVNGERVVLIYLPSEVLPPGDYQLRLYGLTPNNQSVYLGRYTFSVLSK